MRTLRAGVAVLLACSVATAASAQSASQTLNFEIQNIAVLTLAPGSLTLVVNTATAGASYATPASALSAYDITNNQGGHKITAAVDSNMPAGMTLTASLAAVGGGASAGAQTLTTTAVDVVTAIGAVSTSGSVIHYTLTVPAVASPTTWSRIVTYTITAS